jgi:hypothetical protein
MRKAKQCKDKWNKMNVKIRGFNNMWCAYNNQYSSGQYDEDLVENTMKLYKQMTGQPFTLLHIWAALQNHPEWAKFYGP